MLFGSHLYSAPLGTHQAPPLPSISPKVFQLAFVHSSKNLQSIPRSKFSYSEDFVDNERLEWVGDALLYSIVAAYLYRTYPKLRVSYLSSIRQRLVQNSTLAKFATLYNMQEALELGPGYEKLRDDEKTRADAFEAFVGAVAQVHGTEVLTKWLEELIRPYAVQLHDYHAATLGQQPEPDVQIASDSATQAAKAATRYRLCGIFPIPFLLRPTMKAISPADPSDDQAPSASTSAQAYGTFGRTSNAASGSKQGFSRLTDEESDSPAGKARKGKRSQQNGTSSALSQSTSASGKPTSILPAKVADLQRTPSKPGEAGSSSSAPRQAPNTPKAASKSGFKADNESKVPHSSPTKAAQPQPDKPSIKLTNGWKVVESATPAKAPAQASTANGQGIQQPKLDGTAVFIQALQAIRSDPVAFLENHAQYGKRGSATITYVLSTEGKKSVAQAFIGQRLIGQGSAAAGDVNMAKGRAAFKAVEALNLLPDPSQLAAGNSSTAAAGSGWETDEDKTPKNKADNTSWETPGSLSGASKTPAKPPTGSGTGQKATSSPFQKPLDVFPSIKSISTPQSKPAVTTKMNSAAGLPAAIFNSLPGPDKTPDTAQYFVLAVKGFSGGVYCGILNHQRQLIGQASSTKKVDAVEAATKIASKGQVQPSCSWKFVDNDKDQKLGKIAQCKGKRESTGIVPTLTHALGVDASEPSRLIWLEWWAEDKKLWKCTVLADGIFVASGKHADRKTAYNQASSNALDELEKRAPV